MTARKMKQNPVLRLEGEMTVSRAADLKKKLLEALTGADSVEIDLDKVTKIDLACLQLFCSARQTAVRDGKKWCIRNNDGSILLTTGEAAGFGGGEQSRFYPALDCRGDEGGKNG